MRMSQVVAPTLREDPSEAEVVSHKLMLRGGFIKKLAAGVYTFLPLGYRALRNVIGIIREEMDLSGAQEVCMPTIIPAELWQESGRWPLYGKELFRIKDRHDREFCLGPTHEEVITDLVRDSIRSYKQLPANLYQIQTKFRDEVRPRFGLMRGREFLMKDAYSFHTSEESLEKEYQNMYQTYCRIFDRMGLKYRVVEADSGLIGGGFSQEFMVLAETGEEEIFHCNKCNYSASRESAGVGKYKAQAKAQAEAKVTEIHTPNAKTIEELIAFLKISPDQMIKTLIYETEQGAVAALVRGDHAINEPKLKKVLGVEDLRLADQAVIKKVTGAPVGFAGPVGLKGVKIVADHAVELIPLSVSGANKEDFHLINIVYGRDYKADLTGDLRFAVKNDNCPRCGEGIFDVSRGIEVGHIFKLGTKYSDKMRCVYLDEKNQEQVMIMGCYGIGVSRTVAAAIEQNNDKDGMIWPVPLAPFKAAIVPVNAEEPEQKAVAEKIYHELQAKGLDPLLDDRIDRIGVKLKDIDLFGIPFKVIVGPKGLKEGKVEVKQRRTGAMELVPLDQVSEKLVQLIGG
ncbi:proline--tRNA ligase [candidate division WOR-1 bacterium RIFOXYA12_FULL_52_29]|uniref:Proline--tRNA ligase n=1 Tax=candidate division WOR-1 bacterium RIFOXYC12_FULL_54_18 TaxID=1802584 RepID=A0A1F4T4E9_UNCSA|nr:MAG: proline--tRNA ligase [candidate division WOR-1 bacterium RIFOXYA2_FULL_51_19]OGC17019.1 MAG: proline--tRNA ligase [candidate division WOR-1 bacterium RIFOXYA12_FULL_52_29]OGC25880.1 MAG: proline--tRNA ligase [candidate division WOR-1 bacterium RIFOXYB2_FULL_45_9]OGC27436.1 MAG: proline--tRNA ligase [candidate division WOR-1 bacterium RIFOXYC12_FULL_54_18]OGC29351.1 MAG: proline--tRNA ligase [candidate division WOR-1 bacterium RIFOXYB12_FULL_52_16]